MRSLRAGCAAGTLAVGAVLIAGAGVAGAAAYNLRGAPVASFRWSPQLPHIGEPVTITSTSTDLSSRITHYAWDFADNGPFGAFAEGGPVAGATFATPAPHTVRLRVTAADGLSSIATGTIRMTPPPASAHVMYPFPLVRIKGSDFASRVKIAELAVKAPAGAMIALACTGRRCPARRVTRVSRAGRWLRLRRFERSFPAGTVLLIRVSKGQEIGAFTRFHVRKRKLPVRLDSCLDPGAIKPIACPTGA